MKPHQAFSQIDHPLILICQAVLAYYLFKLFFKLRGAKAPLPQILAGLAFSVLSNLVGRVAGADWFFVADITQYGLWAAVTYASVRAVEAAPKIQPDTTSGLAGFFSRYETRIQWSVGLIVAGILVYASVATYYDKQQITASVNATSNRAVAKAITRYDAKQNIYQQERQQILAGVSSVTAALPALTSGLASVSATQQTLLAGQKVAVRTQSPKRRSSPKPAGPPVPVEPIPHNNNGIINREVETPKTEQEEQPKPKEKKGFFKWLFGGKSVSDSIQITPSDTLVFK